MACVSIDESDTQCLLLRQIAEFFSDMQASEFETQQIIFMAPNYHIQSDNS